MKKVIFFMFLSVNGWAACPLYTFPENHKLDQEFNNECDNITNPIINYAKISSATVTAMKVSTLTFSDNTSMTTAAGGFTLLYSSTSCTPTTTCTTNNTFTATVPSLTVTPHSTSSCIEVSGQSNLRCGNSNAIALATIYRDSSNLATIYGVNDTACAFVNLTATNGSGYCSINFMDKRNSVSATTYAVYIRNTNSSNNVCWNDDTNSNSTACLTVKEWSGCSN